MLQKTTDATDSSIVSVSGQDEDIRNFIQQFFSVFDNKAYASVILNYLRDDGFNLGFPDTAIHNKLEFGSRW